MPCASTKSRARARRVKYGAYNYGNAFYAAQTGNFIPEKSNIWRDCVDGYIDWVREHIEEVGIEEAGLPSR